MRLRLRSTRALRGALTIAQWVVFGCVCAGLLWASRAQAQLPPQAQGVLASVREHLRGLGASSVTEIGRAFLFEGEASVQEIALPRAGCFGFLALGTGEVRDVDLALYTRAGQALAEDLAQQPLAYARVCGDAGLALYVSATLYAGRGELLLLQVEDAPRGLERLPESIRLAVSVGGVAEQTRSVGAAPDDLMLDLRLEQAERALQGLGYQAHGRAGVVELRAGRMDGSLLLDAQRCYRVIVYVPVSRGVLVEIQAPPPSEKHWEGRSTQDERVEVPICTEVAGNYRVQVQARSMRGVAIFRAFEHTAAAAPEIRALGDARALAWAEASVLAEARGFRLSHLGEAWVEGSTRNRWPVSLRAGVCYVFAMVAEGGSPAVDARLVGADGVQRARNEGRRDMPLLFTCAERDETLDLVLRARRYDGPVSVWVGESQRAGER